MVRSRRTKRSTVTPEVVLSAYRHGFFPMADEYGEIGFYAYEPRGIIPLDDGFSVRRSLRQICRRHPFEIRYDTAIREVLEACSREGSVPAYEQWLTPELIDLYVELGRRSVVHTVEAWRTSPNGTEHLAGGLYGLAFGAAFCGESMFSREPYASQIALVALVEHLRERQFTLLDAQMPSDHLKQFGLIECSQQEYLELFLEASAKPAEF